MTSDPNPNLFAKYTPREPPATGVAPPPELQIAPMTSGDIDAIASLLAWREGISSEVARQRANDLLNLPHENVVLVARVASDVAGFGRAEFVSRKPPPHENVP